MKKFLLLALSALSFFTMTSSIFAYDATQEDRDLRNEVRAHVDSLYPGSIAPLLRAYGRLQNLTPYLTITYWERGIWFAEKLKEVFVEQLFENNDVCIQWYTQAGDTVEVMYTVRGTNGELLRETSVPLVFNPGAEQVRKSLDDNVYGLQKNKANVDVIGTLQVNPDDEGQRTKEMPRNEIEDNKPPYVGATYVFGSKTIPGAILGTVISMNADTVTFDFEDAPLGKEVVLRVQLEMLRKGCSSTKNSPSNDVTILPVVH